jgi:hypothetical protein
MPSQFHHVGERSSGHHLLFNGSERQQKTAKLRASCGSSGIEIRVSPRVISGGFFFATAARGLSTIAATRAGQSQGQATKVAMLGSRDYVTR